MGGSRFHVRAVLALWLCMLVANVTPRHYPPLLFTGQFASVWDFCLLAELHMHQWRSPICVHYSNVTLPECPNTVSGNRSWVNCSETPSPPTTTSAPTTTTTTTTTTLETTTTSTPLTTTLNTTVPPHNDTAAPTTNVSTTPNETTTELPTTTATNASSTEPETTLQQTTNVAAALRIMIAAEEANQTTAAESMNTTDTPQSNTTSAAPTETDTSSTTTEPPSTATSTPHNTTDHNATSPNATTTETNSSSTVEPNATTTVGPNATTNAPSTTLPPSPAPRTQVRIVFFFSGATTMQTISSENWLLSTNRNDLFPWYGIQALTYNVQPEPMAPFISPNDVRANTSHLFLADDYRFLLSFTTLYRYRLPNGVPLPWLMSRPSLATIWASLGWQLLGLTSDKINITALWFPMNHVGESGAVELIVPANDSHQYDQSMFSCAPAYIPSADVDGFNCWFNLALGRLVNHSGVTVTTSTVLALLNSESVRQQIVDNIGGAVSLQMVPVTELPPQLFFGGFQQIADDATAKYNTEKGYFAAGLSVTFIVVMCLLVGLWIWTGSGRTMQ